MDENLPSAWAGALRDSGYDAVSVEEMKLLGANDAALMQLAQQVGANVLTRDVGHQIDGGFSSLTVQVDRRIRSLAPIIRLLGG